MVSNFKFLDSHFSSLAELGAKAEQSYIDDPSNTLVKLRIFNETIVNIIYKANNLVFAGLDTFNKIKQLQYEDLVVDPFLSAMHYIRKVGNSAAHEGLGTKEEALTCLKLAHSLSQWFMVNYGDRNYVPQEFILPTTHTTVKKSKKSQKDEEDEIQQLALKAVETAATSSTVSKTERIKQAKQTAYNHNMTEAETRVMIDAQLRQVGWEADTINLRYSKGTRPTRGRNLAIAEWPTDSTVGNSGRVDYALFIGLKLVAVVEAKAIHRDIPDVIDGQCKDYARCIREADKDYITFTRDAYKVPFVFATNGRPFIAQYKIKSGIWFEDLRVASNAPRALSGWMSPLGISEMLNKNVELENQVLEQTTYDILEDKNGLNLRYYQLNAIKAAEKAIIAGQEAVLLAMATGTGKTRTVLGMIYRFIETNRFRRVLFLVDRNALGEQAQDVFKDVKISNLLSLNEMYDIKKLEDASIESDTRVHVATVQGMVKRVLYNTGEEKPAVSDYDLIVVDEAHRGYILDKELSDAQDLYRDQEDFQSKYRQIIEYFNAVKIALTATPALHTTEIFGEPVFQYTYREAVIDGYLCDHDAPYHIETELSRSGIIYKPGEQIQIMDKKTGKITISKVPDEIPELGFGLDDFNRKIINRSFNEEVLRVIADKIDPENVDIQGKTLIYAVDDSHADLIVDILKQYYSEMGIDTDCVMKITGATAGGNKKKILEAIKRFKNERFPSVVVTVDLLTTGIDVPEITSLVFMRRVKSRILFEQMLGRATRLCPTIKKSVFKIYDPVGVYESLMPFTQMKPVVKNPYTTFEELIDALNTIEDKQGTYEIIDQIISKLQRKKNRVSPDAAAQFKDITGNDIKTFITELLGSSASTAKQILVDKKQAFIILDDDKNGSYTPTVIIDDRGDKVVEEKYGYGKNDCPPQDYLDEFTKFVQENPNKIKALSLVCTRPCDLTREDLKSLKLALDREGYTIRQLNSAIKEVSNADIAADIISIVRRFAIGSPLVGHEARIKNAIAKLKQAHVFNTIQLNWLQRIETYLLKESVLNVNVFNEDGRFKERGGFNAINKQFGGNLTDIVKEINTYIYEENRKVG